MINFIYFYEGIAVDLGHTTCFATPIYENHALSHASIRSDIGGHHLSNYMMTLLSKSLALYPLSICLKHYIFIFIIIITFL